MATFEQASAAADDSTAASKPKRAAVIYHPLKARLPALRRAVALAARQAGWSETLWFATTATDAGDGATREALAAGVDVVAAAGGDGTVRAVAEALHGSGVPLALLPSGTGNLLARNLHMPLDNLAASARAVFHGESRPVDYCEVQVERPDGRREEFGFVVMAGIGLDARMLANTRPALKRRVGWLAYVDAIARSLRDTASFDFRYRIDDDTSNRALRAHTVIIGNCGTLQGNMLLLPDAEVDDGILDIVALRPRSLYGWVRIGAHIMWENALWRRWGRSRLGQTNLGRMIITRARAERPLRYMRGTRFVLRLDEPDEFEIDGDSIGPIIAFRVRVAQADLVVRVPATSTGPSRGQR